MHEILPLAILKGRKLILKRVLKQIALCISEGSYIFAEITCWVGSAHSRVCRDHGTGSALPAYLEGIGKGLAAPCWHHRRLLLLPGKGLQPMQQILLEGALRHSRLHSSAEQPTTPLIPVHGAGYVEEVILAAHSRRSRERVAFGAGTWHSHEAAVSVKCGAEHTENTVPTCIGQLKRSTRSNKLKGFFLPCQAAMTGPATHPAPKRAALCRRLCS